MAGRYGRLSPATAQSLSYSDKCYIVVLEGWQIETLLAFDFLEYNFDFSLARDIKSRLLMACEMQDLVSALNAIAEAIRTQSRCGATCGDTPDAPAGYVDDGTPPGGFADYQSYRDYKCMAANFVLDTLVSIFTKFRDAPLQEALVIGVDAVIAVVTDALLAVATGYGAVIVGVLGAVASIVAVVIVSTLDFQEIIDAITANRDNLLCDLLNSSSEGDARQRMKNFADGFGWASRAVFDVVASLNAIYKPLFAESNLVYAYADTNQLTPCDCRPQLDYYIAASTYSPAYQNDSVAIVAADTQSATFRITSSTNGGGSYLLFDAATNQPITAPHTLLSFQTVSYSYCSYNAKFFYFNTDFTAASVWQHDYLPPLGQDALTEWLNTRVNQDWNGFAADCDFVIEFTITHPAGYGLV